MRSMTATQTGPQDGSLVQDCDNDNHVVNRISIQDNQISLIRASYHKSKEREIGDDRIIKRKKTLWGGEVGDHEFNTHDL